MKNPDPPFIEYSFYRSGDAPDFYLHQVVDMYLRERKAEVYQTVSSVSTNANFKFPTRDITHGPKSYAKSLASGHEILKVVVEPLLPTVPQRRECVLRPSSPHRSKDHGEVTVIAIDGSELEACGARKAHKIKSVIISDFQRWISLLKPDYAAINSEISLPKPEHIPENGDDYAFRDVYVYKELASKIDIHRFSHGLTYIALPYGTMFLSSRMFTEGAVEDSHSISKEISLMIRRKLT